MMSDELWEAIERGEAEKGPDRFEEVLNKMIECSFDTLDEVQRRLGALIYLDEDLLRSIALSSIIGEFQAAGGNITLVSGFVTNTEQKIVISGSEKLMDLLYIIRTMYPYELLLNMINKLISRQRYGLLRVLYRNVSEYMGSTGGGILATGDIREKIRSTYPKMIMTYILHSLWSGYFAPKFILSTISKAPNISKEFSELADACMALLRGIVEYGKAYIFAGRIDFFKEGGGITTVRLLDGKTYLLGRLHDDTFIFDLNLEHIRYLLGKRDYDRIGKNWEYDEELINTYKNFINVVIPYDIVNILRPYGDDFEAIVFGIIHKHISYVPSARPMGCLTDYYLKAIALFDARGLKPENMIFSTTEFDAPKRIFDSLRAIFS